MMTSRQTTHITESQSTSATHQLTHRPLYRDATATEPVSAAAVHQTVADKLSDYEDVWTPSPNHTPTPAPPLPPVVCSMTLPSRRPRCVLDPAKYQLPSRPSAGPASRGTVARTDRQCSSPAVFQFDQTNVSTSSDLLSVDTTSCNVRRSPVYAEPCDGLGPGLRLRVRPRVVTTSPTPISPASSVVTPPISANYKLPHDFLLSPTTNSQLRTSGSDVTMTSKTATSVVDNQTSSSRLSVKSPVSVAISESPVDDGDSRQRRTDHVTEVRHDGASLRACAAAAVTSMRSGKQPQRRSNYDNVSDDDIDVDDEGTGERSRHPTVSSVRTEYSPPWDADRWRFLVGKTRQMSDLPPLQTGSREFECGTGRSLVSKPTLDGRGRDNDDDGEFLYSELESLASSTADDSEFFGSHPPQLSLPGPPSTAFRSQPTLPTASSMLVCSVATGHSQCRLPASATTPTSASSVTAVASSRTSTVDARVLSQRRRSPDVIPTLRPKIISPRNRGHQFPGAKIGDLIVKLANMKPEQTFSALIRNFVQCTLSGSEKNPQTVLRNVRQFMNGVKNYLSHGGVPELDSFIQTFRAQMSPSEFLNLDAVMERALMKSIVKPLKEHIYRLFTYDLTRNGSLQLLCDGLKLVKTPSPGVLPGLIQIDVTSSVSDDVSQFLKLMDETYSPLKKLENLLGAMTILHNFISVQYRENGNHRSVDSVSADDLLSILMRILAEQNLQSAEIEASFMWGLIEPSFLVGDSRYFLMTFSSAVDRLKAVRKFVQSAPLGQRSIREKSSVENDGYIRVVSPDETCDRLIRHQLPLQHSMRVSDACCMLAYRLKITNPQDYGLYSVKSSTGIATLLSSNEALSSSADLGKSLFIYKRTNAYFIWSTSIDV